MEMLQDKKVVLGLGLAAGAFLGYCVYFDYKRHADPNFKQKLREKRRRARQQRQRGGGRAGPGPQRMPNINDPTEMQAFFLQEVQLGEELLAAGDLDNGVDHLCNAITMCGQPQQMLQILQQTLPPEAFQLLVQKLPEVGSRMARTMQGEGGLGGGMVGAGGDAPTGPSIDELDVEDVE